MKFVLTAVTVVGATTAFAGDAASLAGKTDSAPTFSGSPAAVGVGPVVQMLIALGIVLAIVKFILPKFVGKFNRRLTTGIGSAIKIEESAHFAGGTLYVVRAKSKSLLLSVTNQGVACLADITEAPTPEPPSFEELVEAAPAMPEFVFKRPEPTPDDVESALTRLAQLTR